ncbi:unnamed protein product [Hyaloperonospora brassicae]|uniref:tRNA-5-taurinomethyluridine 2-sulfurtransferase n=1 Tax=Hyaloperonospora brassicae TaxID=162125 RepID=A0AAV0SWL4_HYABA|nr:unnamed protein product [Hyaloperonospora brassicae]
MLWRPWRRVTVATARRGHCPALVINVSRRSAPAGSRHCCSRAGTTTAATSAATSPLDCRTSGNHVVVGMSGGVDSSVAAVLLKRQGYHVTGVYMQNWDPSDEQGRAACPIDADYSDVENVCQQLNIEAKRVNLVQSYWNHVFAPCLDGYAQGLTPNPDVLCNREIKFKAFTDYAKMIGADYVATGHYAALRPVEAGSAARCLYAARDRSKDQSYFLSSVSGSAFANVLFPLGDMDKTAVRRLAAQEGLCTATKRDSVGMCFIGKRKFADFIHQYVQQQHGHFSSLEGARLHPHQGFAAYTVGQGARVPGMAAKWFVVGKHQRDHSVTIAQGTRHPALFSDALFASMGQFNWIAGQVPRELSASGGRLRCFYRVRYRQELDECTVSLVSRADARAGASTLSDWPTAHGALLDDEQEATGSNCYLRVDFDHPQRGIAPEQALVLYRADGLCYGGGPIATAAQTYYEQHKSVADSVWDWHRQGQKEVVGRGAA